MSCLFLRAVCLFVGSEGQPGEEVFEIEVGDVEVIEAGQAVEEAGDQEDCAGEASVAEEDGCQYEGLDGGGDERAEDDPERAANESHQGMEFGFGSQRPHEVHGAQGVHQNGDEEKDEQPAIGPPEEQPPLSQVGIHKSLPPRSAL